VLADIWVGFLKNQTEDTNEAMRIINRAVEMANRMGDQEASQSAKVFLLQMSRAPQHATERTRMAEELWKSALPAGEIWALQPIVVIGDAFLVSGERQRAEEAWSEVKAQAERTGNVRLGLISATMDSILTLMDGHLEKALDIVESIMTRGEEAGLVGIALVYSSLVGLRVRVYLGASLEAHETALRDLLEETKIKRHPSLPQLCLVLAHLGRKEEPLGNPGTGSGATSGHRHR
jgi:ATP/maltotriose-dependent transcriptional regulator MalT